MRKAAAVCLVVLFACVLAGCATGPRPPSGHVAIKRPMEVTGYCKCGKCCNWKRNWLFQPVIASGRNKGKRKDVGVTASGTKADIGTIAADTSRYPFGTVMYIPGYGYGRVEDRGSAMRGDKIDLFFKSHKDALEWGRERKEVTVWLPRSLANQR